MLAMQLLGPSLLQLLKQSRTGAFSIRTVIEIGIQLIDCLQVTHQLGFIHANINLTNIVIGSNDLHCLESRKIYLIDFGKSQTFWDEDMQHIKFE